MATNSVAAPRIANFEPFGLAYRTDPEPFLSELIEASPFFVELEGVKSAIVGSYGHATRVLRDWKSFSSVKPKNLPGMERIDFFNGLPVMNYSDPPEQTRRRKVVNPAFTPKRVETLLDATSRQIAGILDRAAEKGRFDGIQDLAKPMAKSAILENFLNVTDERVQKIFADYSASLPLLDKMKPGDPKPAAFLDAWDRGQAYCLEQLDLTRRGKTDGIIAVIAQSVIDGSLDEREMMAMMTVLLIAGVSTTAAAVGSSFRFLAANPDIADRIRKQPELAELHLEESLRMDSPITLLMRFGTESSMIGDVAIPKDMPVYVMLGPANRDPAVFADPTRFNIDRANVSDHIAFGFGMHTCMGNALSRKLVPEAIRQLVHRFKEIHLAPLEDAIVVNTASPRARHLERIVLDVA